MKQIQFLGGDTIKHRCAAPSEHIHHYCELREKSWKRNEPFLRIIGENQFGIELRGVCLLLASVVNLKNHSELLLSLLADRRGKHTLFKKLFHLRLRFWAILITGTLIMATELIYQCTLCFVHYLFGYVTLFSVLPFSLSQRFAKACWMFGLFAGSGSSRDRRKFTAAAKTLRGKKCHMFCMSYAFSIWKLSNYGWTVFSNKYQILIQNIFLIWILPDHTSKTNSDLMHIGATLATLAVPFTWKEQIVL